MRLDGSSEDVQERAVEEEVSGCKLVVRRRNCLALTRSFQQRWITMPIHSHKQGIIMLMHLSNNAQRTKSALDASAKLTGSSYLYSRIIKMG